MGSLTSLLVLTSLLNTWNDHLPTTSYFKLVDGWNLIHILIVASITAVHVVIDIVYLKKNKYVYSRHRIGVYYDSARLIQRDRFGADSVRRYYDSAQCNCIIINPMGTGGSFSPAGH